MAVNTKKYDDIFRAAVEKQRWSPQMMVILKGIVMVESTFMPRAYRYEAAFFKGLVKKEPWWADKDPAIVSASYGLGQIMFTTAWALGLKPDNWKKLNHAEFQALAEKLYEPELNIGYQAALLRLLMDKVWEFGLPNKWPHLSALDISLARYNGGEGKNPDENGDLRLQNYVDKVWRAVDQIKKLEAK